MKRKAEPRLEALCPAERLWKRTPRPSHTQYSAFCLMLASDYSKPLSLQASSGVHCQRPEDTSGSRPLSRPLHPLRLLTARTELLLSLQGSEWWWSEPESFATCFLGKLSSLKKEGGARPLPALFNLSLWLLLEEILRICSL